MPPSKPVSITTTKITAVRVRVLKVARFKAIDADEFGMDSFNIQNTRIQPVFTQGIHLPYKRTGYTPMHKFELNASGNNKE